MENMLIVYAVALVLGALFWIIDSVMYQINVSCDDCGRASNTLTFSLHDEGRHICEYCADEEMDVLIK